MKRHDTYKLKSPVAWLPVAKAAILSISLSVLTGCSKEDERVAPLKSDMEASLKTALPAFLSLNELETEAISIGENRVKINFKAEAGSSDDLYIVDRYFSAEDRLPILRQSQKAGESVKIYGKMTAERIMDKWDISSPEIQSGMTQLGSPRGSFDPRAIIDGSPEMKKFLSDREAERARLVEAEEQRQRENEQARLALLEEKRRASEMRRKALTEATAVGKRYRGILVQSPGRSETRQAVEIEFTSQSGSLITAELHNPDEPTHKQTFTGELVFDPQDESGSSEDGQHPIILSPRQVSAKFMEDRFRIYFEQCVLRLDMNDDGLEGLAYANLSNSTFALRMQPLENKQTTKESEQP